MKKAKAKPKAKGKATASKPKETRSPRTRKPVDLGAVRQNITNLVAPQAPKITQSVMNEARKGNLAPMKYLFEMIGLYPAPDGPGVHPSEDSLVKSLLHRLNQPDEPVLDGTDGNQGQSVSNHAAAKAESAGEARPKRGKPGDGKDESKSMASGDAKSSPDDVTVETDTVE